MKQTKITKSARGKMCSVRLPGCNPGPDNETVVFAHAPSVDKGMGIKTPDVGWGAYACHSCHDILDGRSGIRYRSSREATELIEGSWLPAIYETQKQLIGLGLLKVVE